MRGKGWPASDSKVSHSRGGRTGRTIFSRHRTATLAARDAVAPLTNSALSIEFFVDSPGGRLRPFMPIFTRRGVMSSAAKPVLSVQPHDQVVLAVVECQDLEHMT